MLVEINRIFLVRPAGTWYKKQPMANTCTRIHLQAVFTVQNRDCMILNAWKEEFYKYISGIAQKYNQQLLLIHGMPHQFIILFGFRPSPSIADLMQTVKGSSSKWINDKNVFMISFQSRRYMGHFIVANLKCLPLFNTFRIKRSTLKQKPFPRNSMISWRSLKSILKTNISLNMRMLMITYPRSLKQLSHCFLPMPWPPVTLPAGRLIIKTNCASSTKNQIRTIDILRYYRF